MNPFEIMNANTESPIVDRTCISQNINADVFIEWVKQRGWKIYLNNISFDDGQIGFAASLGGTCRGYELGCRLDWIGYGQSKEKAIEQLAQRCSERLHYPNVRNGWFRVHLGDAERFPSFEKAL